MGIEFSFKSDIKNKPFNAPKYSEIKKVANVAIKSQMLHLTEHDTPARTLKLWKSLQRSFKSSTSTVKSDLEYSGAVYEGVTRSGKKMNYQTTKHSTPKAKWLEDSWKNDRKKYEQVLKNVAKKLLEG